MAGVWRTEGSELLGLTLVRTINHDESAATSRAKVVGWLDRNESEYIADNGELAGIQSCQLTNFCEVGNKVGGALTFGNY